MPLIPRGIVRVGDADDVFGTPSDGYGLLWIDSVLRFEMKPLARLDAANTFTVADGAAISVGPNGNTNPTLRVVTNVGSAETGVSVTGNAAGDGASLSVLSSGANERLIIRPKGTSGLVIQRSGDTLANCPMLIPRNLSGDVELLASTGASRSALWCSILYISSGAGAYGGAAMLSNGGLRVISTVGMAWASSSNAVSGTTDTALFRNAAGIVEVNNGTAGQWGGLRLGAPNSTTVPVIVRGAANQSAPLLLLQGQSSTTAGRDMAHITTGWADPTDLTRAGRLVLSAFSTTTAQEGLRIDGDADGVKLGFYAQTAVARQVLATGAGALVDDVITVLQNLGLVKQS